MILNHSLLFTLGLLSGSLARPFPMKESSSGSGSNSSTSSSSFAADPSINVAAIYAAAQAAKSQSLATFPTTQDKTHYTTIYGDWLNLPGVSAFQFIADMDIDCDGADDNCPGSDSSGGSESTTAWGHLDASQVPWFVIPDQFTSEKLKPNALGAVICDGKMFYAIFGDTNGDGVPVEDGKKSEVIGEGSILLGQTCFPDAGINGNKGHGTADVAYIIFGEQVPSGVGDKTIDISALKTLGDQQVKLLESALKIGSGSDDDGADSRSGLTTPVANTTTASPSSGASSPESSGSISHSSGGDDSEDDDRNGNADEDASDGDGSEE